MPTIVEAPNPTDNEVIQRVLAGDVRAYEVIVRKYNRRLYLVARSLVAEDEAEDVMQEAYVRALQHLNQFEGRSSFATWLTRIAVHEAYRRMRLRQRFAELDESSHGSNGERDMEQSMLTGQARRYLEQAVDTLPEKYKSVFMLREIEGLATGEVAESLGIGPAVVKVRLMRARRMLRDALMERSRATTAEAFQFMGVRCDRVTENVLARISILEVERHSHSCNALPATAPSFCTGGGETCDLETGGPARWRLWRWLQRWRRGERLSQTIQKAT